MQDIDHTELEHTIRFRKKIQKDEDYIASLKAMVDKADEVIKQNNAIDIYEEYFSGAIVDHSTEMPYAKTLTVFKVTRQDLCSNVTKSRV